VHLLVLGGELGAPPLEDNELRAHLIALGSGGRGFALRGEEAAAKRQHGRVRPTQRLLVASVVVVLKDTLKDVTLRACSLGPRRRRRPLHLALDLCDAARQAAVQHLQLLQQRHPSDRHCAQDLAHELIAEYRDWDPE